MCAFISRTMPSLEYRQRSLQSTATSAVFPHVRTIFLVLNPTQSLPVSGCNEGLLSYHSTISAIFRLLSASQLRTSRTQRILQILILRGPPSFFATSAQKLGIGSTSLRGCDLDSLVYSSMTASYKTARDEN